MDSDTVSRRTLHLSYILDSDRDMSQIASASRENTLKKDNEEKEKQHQELFNDIKDEVEKLCRRLKTLILECMLEYGLDNEEVLKSYKGIKSARGVELLNDCRSDFINLLTIITTELDGNDEQTRKMISFLEEERDFTDELLFTTTLERAKLLLVLISLSNKLSIDQNIESEDVLQGPLWTPGGIENFKLKRRKLKEQLRGKRQPFIRDANLWKKARERMQHQRLLSIRGFGGYGKTTLARELIYDLLERVDEVFTDYYLISFKSDEQGDYDVESGKTKSVDTGFRRSSNSFDSVINDIYCELLENFNPIENARVSIEEKKEKIIAKLCKPNASCLVVLDNYEDIEAVDEKNEDKQKFLEFFKDMKKQASKAKATSCILITSRAPKDKDSGHAFITIDLGGEDKIDMSTSRRILMSYLDEQISRGANERSLITKAMKNLDHNKEGWDEVQSGRVEGYFENWNHTYVVDILKYPLVINHFASRMIATGNTPARVVSDFLGQMLEDKDGELIETNVKDNNLIRYVISRSFELMLDESHYPLIETFTKKFSNTTNIRKEQIFNLYPADDLRMVSNLWDKLIELKFVVEKDKMKEIYEIPPLVKAFLVETYGSKKDNSRITVNQAISRLGDEKEDSYEDIMQWVEVVVGLKRIDDMSKNAIANTLHNTLQQVIDDKTYQNKRNWLAINEHIESQAGMLISSKETIITAGRLLSQIENDLDGDIDLDDYESTISSIIRQLNFEITKNDEHGQSIFDLISKHKSKHRAKLFNTEVKYSSEETLVFDSRHIPELVVGSGTKRIFSIDKENKESVYFVYYDLGMEKEEVVKRTVLITRTPQPDVYDIIPMNENEKYSETSENIQSDEFSLDGLVLEIINQHQIFSDRWELAQLSLSKLNKYSPRKIDSNELRKILDENPEFEVDMKRGPFLVRRISKTNAWTELTKKYDLPENEIVYSCIFKMIHYNMLNTGENKFTKDRLFTNRCMKYCEQLSRPTTAEKINNTINLIQHDRGKATYVSTRKDSRNDYLGKFLPQLLLLLEEGTKHKLALERQKALGRNPFSRASPTSTRKLESLIEPLKDDILKKSKSEDKTLENMLEDYSDAHKEKMEQTQNYDSTSYHHDIIDTIIRIVIKACEEGKLVGDLKHSLREGLDLSIRSLDRSISGSLGGHSTKCELNIILKQFETKFSNSNFWKNIAPWSEKTLSPLSEEEAKQIISITREKYGW